MFRYLEIGALGLIALPLFALPASAQVALPDIVISANQVPQPADRVGASVTVLHGEEMRAKGVETVVDALRTVPGLHVQSSGSKGSLTQVRIRGGDGNHLLVIVDGVPVNRLDAGDFDFADFLIDDIDRVEVVRGPQSGIYGGNAHTGVISIFTKSGRGLRKPELTIRSEGGTQRSHWLSGGIAHHTGNVYGAYIFQHRETDGFNISRLGNEKDGHRVFTFNGKTGIDLTENLNVEGIVRHVDRRLQNDPETFVPIPDAYGLDQFAQTNLRGNATLTTMDGRLVQRLGLFNTDLRYSNFNPAFGAIPFRSWGQTLGADYKGSLQYNLGPVANTSVFVLDTLNESYQNRSAFSAADEQRSRVGTAYEHIFDFATGLTVSGAARQDFHDKFADFFTWRIALSQRLPTNTRLHSNIGKGVTLPNFNDMFAGGIPNFRANPDLKPESSIGWDFGVEQTFWNGMLVLDVTYFASRAQDRITRVAAPLPAPPGTTTVINADGISPRQGVELTAKLNPWSWLTLESTYTYTDSESPQGFQEIRRPHNAGSFTATFRLPDNKTRASFTVVHNGRMADDAFIGFPATRVLLSDYTLVNAIITHNLTPTSQLYVRGENLLNEKYEEIFSYRSPGATVFAGYRVRFGEEATPFR